MDDELRTRYAALVSLFEPTDPFEAVVKPLIASAADYHQIRALTYLTQTLSRLYHPMDRPDSFL
jgi:hypothetical protein